MRKKKHCYLAYVFPDMLVKEEASTKKKKEIRSIKLKIHCAVHLFLPRLMSGKSWMAPSWFFHQTDERWIKAHSWSAAPLPREEDLNSFGARAAIDPIAKQPQKRIDRQTDSAGRDGEEERWRLPSGRKRLAGRAERLASTLGPAARSSACLFQRTFKCHLRHSPLLRHPTSSSSPSSPPSSGRRPSNPPPHPLKFTEDISPGLKSVISLALRGCQVSIWGLNPAD